MTELAIPIQLKAIMLERQRRAWRDSRAGAIEKL
jgi:hypothetical protein